MTTIFKKESKVNSNGNEIHAIRYGQGALWFANDAEHLNKGYDKLNSYQALEPKGFMEFYDNLPPSHQLRFESDIVEKIKIVAIGMGYIPMSVYFDRDCDK